LKEQSLYTPTVIGSVTATAGSGPGAPHEKQQAISKDPPFIVNFPAGSSLSEDVSPSAVENLKKMRSQDLLKIFWVKYYFNP